MTFKHLDPVTLEDYPQNFQLVANKFPLLQPVRFLSLASERGLRNAWCAQFSVLQNSTLGTAELNSWSHQDDLLPPEAVAPNPFISLNVGSLSCVGASPCLSITISSCSLFLGSSNHENQVSMAQRHH